MPATMLAAAEPPVPLEQRFAKLRKHPPELYAFCSQCQTALICTRI
jgi:hypothetical protein